MMSVDAWFWWFFLFTGCTLLGGCGPGHHHEGTRGYGPAREAEESTDHHAPHGAQTIATMNDQHAHLGPHFRWTAKRPPSVEDQRKAEELVRSLRDSLAPYQDYRVAMQDGYEPFLPQVQQPRYHFTSKWRGFKAAFRFDPAEPTSLLYKKTAEGYELEGAMYTAPKRASEEELNKRVPLSIAQWHAHVDICLPPRDQGTTADWTQFGPRGTLVEKEECDRLGGRFYSQLFGWMIHVYPYRDTPEMIWTH